MQEHTNNNYISEKQMEEVGFTRLNDATMILFDMNGTKIVDVIVAYRLKTFEDLPYGGYMTATVAVTEYFDDIEKLKDFYAL